MTETTGPEAATEPTVKSFETAEYRIHPLAEAIVIGAVVFLAIFSTTYFIYRHALEAQKGEIREGLVRTGKVLAAYIDGDGHRTFQSRDQETTEAYAQALRPLEQVLRADRSIRYVYTAVLKDGKVRFVLDAAPSGDADGDGVDDKAHIMEEYPEADEDMLRALRERVTVTSAEPYVDRWGSFVSGYVPFFDSRGGFVGILGIDIDSSNYFARLAPIKRATVRAMVTGFFIAFLVSAAVWFTRNFSRVINRSRLTIHREYQHLAKRARP